VGGQKRSPTAKITFSSRPIVSMAEVAAYTHSWLHIKTRGFAGNYQVGTLVPGAAFTADDVNSLKTSKFKTGTAISEDLVPGRSPAA
jgi:hypothetical protein